MQNTHTFSEDGAHISHWALLNEESYTKASHYEERRRPPGKDGCQSAGGVTGGAATCSFLQGAVVAPPFWLQSWVVSGMLPP